MTYRRHAWATPLLPGNLWRNALMAPPEPMGNQQAELHRTIWRIANDLRGSVDGWDFKTYVLGMLFYRFISENLTAYINEMNTRQAIPTSTTPPCQTRRPSSPGPRR